MLISELPEIYSLILPKAFLELAPKEKLATCSNCFKTQSCAPKPHFDPSLKCCTYYPFLPNYLVGGILSDPKTHEGAQKVKELIRNRTYALPLGIFPPPKYQEAFNARKPNDYGNRADLLCPFYINSGGKCSVWRHRGHECSTYFCHSSYGESGEKFWSEVRQTLFEVEMFLSQHAMIEFGFYNREIDTNLSYLKNESYKKGQGWALPAPEWSTFWAHQLERIEEFYKDCFQFVMDRSSELKRDWYENRYRSSANHSRLLAALLMGREVPKDHLTR